MKPELAIRSLSMNKEAFTYLLVGILPEEYNWRPAPEKWNILEIVCHLKDEEKEDFKPRVKGTLEDPSKPFKPIDPQKWVKGRKYAKKDYFKALTALINERDASVEWLRSLKEPKWDNVYQHEQLGALSAQLFLENWVAHDMLHIRQIMNTRLGYLKHIAKEPLDYAGGV